MLITRIQKCWVKHTNQKSILGGGTPNWKFSGPLKFERTTVEIKGSL